jgi:membrane protein DedA with SNARE-associated domain
MRPGLERWGAWGLLFGYFIPGVRHVTAYVAGTARLSLRVFACFAYTGALVWSGTFVSIGYLVGKEWQPFAEALHQHLLLVAVLLVVLGVSYLLIHRKLRCTP